MAARGPKSDKFWADAVRLAVFREETIDEPNVGKRKVKRLNIIAENVAKLAMQGEAWAIQEIGNRLDGKPAQSVEGDLTGTFNVVLRGDDAEL